METHLLPGANPSEPARTAAREFGDWLTVSEAVAYCSLNHLDRTPKTIRKWALRSHHDPDNAELSVRREDVDNGFRWTIEMASLDRKIAQELEFEARRASERLSTRPDESGAVQTGTGASDQVDSPANTSEPVQSGAHRPEPVREPDWLIDELRERIEGLKGEVDFLRDELRDRRQTTTALTDVIEAFRLTAQGRAGRGDQNRMFSEGDNDRRQGAGDAV